MKKVVLSCFLILLLVPLFAQDADIVTRILAKKTVTCIDFSYLVASELGMECTPFEAYTYCDRFGCFPFKASADKPVTVRMVSLFLMKNYGLNGGVLWSATHNSRYAWKELKASGFWKTGIDPNQKLSGRDMVRAISKFFMTYPDARLRNPPTPEAPTELRNALLADKEETK